MDFKYDLGIVGSGPAGYTAALHGRRKGLSVVLFEKAEVGGVCLNRGCIPTKTVLHSVELFEEVKSGEVLGIYASDVKADFSGIMERKNQVVSKLRKGLELSLKNSGTVLVNSKATIKDKNTIEAGGET